MYAFAVIAALFELLKSKILLNCWVWSVVEKRISKVLPIRLVPVIGVYIGTLGVGTLGTLDGIAVTTFDVKPLPPILLAYTLK